MPLRHDKEGLHFPERYGILETGDNMKRNFFRGVFALYILVMLWLLFIRYRSVEITDYWAQFAGRVNLVPFSSIGSMLHNLWHYPLPSVWRQVIYNLGGNIIMFVPLGFFLRTLVPGCAGFWRCMAATAVIMASVEAIQLFTLRGFCETDDLLLNLAGAAIGWLGAKCCPGMTTVP